MKPASRAISSIARPASDDEPATCCEALATLVAVRDHEVPLPRTGLEVRADGLWGELVCETPLEHWSIGLEAFGLGYDDPADASERNHRAHEWLRRYHNRGVT